MDLAIKEALLLRSKECNKLDDFIPHLDAVRPMLGQGDLEQISSRMTALFLHNYGGLNHDPNKSTIDRISKLLAFWKGQHPKDYVEQLPNVLKYNSQGELDFENFYKHSRLLTWTYRVHYIQEEAERLEAFFLMLWHISAMPELATTNLLAVMVAIILDL